MTPFPYSIEADAPLAEAHVFMRERRIRHLPVTDRGQLAGVLTDRDIKLALGPDLGLPPERELAVRDVFQPDTYVVDAGTTLQDLNQSSSPLYTQQAICLDAKTGPSSQSPTTSSS